MLCTVHNVRAHSVHYGPSPEHNARLVVDMMGQKRREKKGTQFTPYYTAISLHLAVAPGVDGVCLCVCVVCGLSVFW